MTQAAPTNLSILYITPISCAVTWDSIPNAQYHYQASVHSDFSYPICDVNDANPNTVSLTGLTANTIYYWRVNDTVSGNTSDWAIPSPATFTTATLPPSNIVISSIGTSHFTIAWNSVPELW